MKKKENQGLLPIILLIISLIIIIVFKSFIGTLLAIVTLVVSIVNLKSKNILVIISFIGSILIIIFSIFAFIFSFNTINKTLSKSKLAAYQSCERLVESNAQTYKSNNNLTPNLDGNIILSIGEVTNSCSSYCNGYVIIDTINDKYDAYLKCDGYTTDGFDSDIYSNLN